jgi:signal transduction histidine kinase
MPRPPSLRFERASKRFGLWACGFLSANSHCSFSKKKKSFAFTFVGIPLITIGNSGWMQVLPSILALFLFALVIYMWRRHRTERAIALDRLRKQIARDFHDELGSYLSVIAMYSELAKSRVKKNDIAGKNYLEKVISASNGMYGSMKDMLWALNPGQDKLEDLLMKIKDFGEELYGDSGIVFRADGLQENTRRLSLSMDQKRHILLIFKEAMNNALRHSGATEVVLNVHNTPTHLSISLSDNGTGLAPGNPGRGEGLKNMKSRAQKIGGEWIMNSSPTGLCVELRLSIQSISGSSIS